MENNERHIINKIICGETSQFSYFVEKYSAQIYSLIMGIVGNHEDAEELAQDTFVKAYSKLSSFKTDSKFSTWLYRIAYNTAISFTRKRTDKALLIDENIFTDIHDEEVDKVLDDDSDDSIERLYRAIEKLQPDEKSVIQLFYMDEKPLADIAEIMNISESNAKVKLHRTRKKLYLLIKDEYGE